MPLEREGGGEEERKNENESRGLVIYMEVSSRREMTLRGPLLP